MRDQQERSRFVNIYFSTSPRESRKQYHTKKKTQTALWLSSRALLLLRSFLQDSPAHMRDTGQIIFATHYVQLNINSLFCFDVQEKKNG